MYKCPKCEKETISNSTKIMLGPARSVRCSNCHSRVSVSWWTWVISVSLLVGLWIIKGFVEPYSTWILTMVLMGSYLYIHMKFIPLEIRKDKKQH